MATVFFTQSWIRMPSLHRWATGTWTSSRLASKTSKDRRIRNSDSTLTGPHKEKFPSVLPMILRTGLRISISSIDAKTKKYYSTVDSPQIRVNTYTRVSFKERYKPKYTATIKGWRQIFETIGVDINNTDYCGNVGSKALLIRLDQAVVLKLFRKFQLYR